MSQNDQYCFPNSGTKNWKEIGENRGVGAQRNTLQHET